MRSLKVARFKALARVEKFVQRLVTKLAYRIGMRSPSETLEGDEMMHVDTEDSGRIVYWHSGLERFFVAEPEDESE